MTTRELHFYDEEALALRQRLIRRFDNCTVWAAERDGVFYLLLDERARKHTTLCEYRNHTEFEEDRDYLKNLPPGGLAGVGVVPTNPPPAGTGAAARSLPPED
jgi:hypothetical protein